MTAVFDANQRMTQPSIQRLARATRERMAVVRAQQPGLELAALGTLPGLMEDLMLLLPLVLSDSTASGDRILYRGQVIQRATKTIGVLEHLLMTLDPIRTDVPS